MSEAASTSNIVLFESSDGEVRLDVAVDVGKDEIWLNRSQMSLLFDRDVKTIGKYIANALKEELENSPKPTVAKFATVQKEGERFVTRQVEFYNLDMILSIGYRVKSKRGILFRQWANKVLKDYLLKGYSINQRLNEIEQKIDNKFFRIEKTIAEHDKKIDFFVRTSMPPVEGIFFDGQIFDAYKFATDLIKSAEHSLILIDNYVDESVLLMLSKRCSGVSATIYTHKISAQLQLDLNRHNDQYPPIQVRTYKSCHDRFLIIDETEVYHIGASLKDLGKKMFAFSKLDLPAHTIINVL